MNKEESLRILSQAYDNITQLPQEEKENIYREIDAKEKERRNTMVGKNTRYTLAPDVSTDRLKQLLEQNDEPDSWGRFETIDGINYVVMSWDTHQDFITISCFCDADTSAKFLIFSEDAVPGLERQLFERYDKRLERDIKTMRIALGWIEELRKEGMLDA